MKKLGTFELQILLTVPFFLENAFGYASEGISLFIQCSYICLYK